METIIDQAVKESIDRLDKAQVELGEILDALKSINNAFETCPIKDCDNKAGKGFKYHGKPMCDKCSDRLSLMRDVK